MKSISILMSALALTAGLGLTPVVAQDRMLGGNAVGADRMMAAEAKCASLRAAEANESTTSNNDTATNTDTQPNSNTVGDPDFADVTLAMCDEGGFTAVAVVGGMAVQADQMEAVQARCLELGGGTPSTTTNNDNASSTGTQPNSNTVGDQMDSLTAEACAEAGMTASAM